MPDKSRGIWRMKYKPDPLGPWVTVTLGKDPSLKASRAAKPKPPQWVTDRRDEFAEVEYRAKHGIGAAPARAKTLESYAAAYLEAYALSHKHASARMAKRHMNSFVAFAASKGVTTVQGVTRALCREYLESRIQVVSHDTLTTEVRYLSPLWTRAVDEDLMLKNPWARIKVPGKSTRSDPTYWSEAEVARIAAACSKAWQSDLVMFLANTGMRISTALAMRWSWVDWRTGVVTIPKSEATHRTGVKTGYSVALNRPSRDVLQRRKFVAKGGDDELVFPNPVRPGAVPYDTAQNAICAAIKRAGVKKGTAHDLRHTYGRHLAAKYAMNVVQSQMGHTNASTTRIYTDLSKEDIAEQLQDFGIGDAPEG
jgi:integrase